MHTLRRPRHLIATALVFLLAGGAGTGLLGVQAADDAQRQTLVADFHIPLPSQGDMGRFALHEEGTIHDLVVAAREEHAAANPGLYPDGLEETSKEFRWMEDRLLPTTDGQLTLSNRLRYNTAPLYVNGVVGPIMEAGSNQAFGHEWLASRQDDGREQVNMRYEYTSLATVPCHLRNGFQGKIFDVTAEPVHLGMACKVPSSADSLGQTWQPLGVVPDSEPPVVVFHNRHETASFVATTELWLQDGLPYPIKSIEHWERKLGDDPHWGTTTLTLEAYTAGTEPIATVPSTLPLPPLGMIPRQDVPSDAMLDVRFPLRDAVSVLEQDDAAASFLATHPDAYLGYAQHYAYTTDEERVLDTWVLVLSDGGDTMGREVRQWTGPMVVQQPFGPVTSVPLPVEDEPTYEVENGTISHPETFPSPSDLPDVMPRLGDLVAQWRATVTTHREPLPADSWGFDLSEGAMRVNVGHYRYERDDDDPFGNGDTEITADITRMTWNGTQIVAFSEYRQAPDDQPRISQWHAASFTAVSDADWLPLTPLQAAGITLGALLAAALYYLSPLLKGLVGGFSRIHGAAVLEHPVRQAALDLIRAEPGIHHRELVRRVGVGQGAATHHLRKLQAASLVDRVQQGRYACYFAKGQVDHRIQVAAPVLRPEPARAILRTLHVRPASTGPDLLAAVSVGQSTLQYHLKRLRDAGLVEGTPCGRRMAWHLTDAGQRVIGAGLHA